MATEKNLFSRIQQKRGSSADWNKATNFVPKDGEVIIYSDLHKIKVGDGVHNVTILPFSRTDWSELDHVPASLVSADDVSLTTPILPPGVTKIPTHLSDLNSDTNYMTVSQAEKDYWNSKGGGGSSGGGAVASVNGKVGVVTLGAEDIPYSDALYPEVQNQSDFNQIMNLNYEGVLSSLDSKQPTGNYLNKDSTATQTLNGNLSGKYLTGTWLQTTATTTDNTLSSLAAIDPNGWVYKIDKSQLVQDVIAALPKWTGNKLY